MAAALLWALLVTALAWRARPDLFHSQTDVERWRASLQRQTVQPAAPLATSAAVAESELPREPPDNAPDKSSAPSQPAPANESVPNLAHCRRRVRSAMRHAFGGYRRHAFGHDEVAPPPATACGGSAPFAMHTQIRPVTNRTNDSWGGFGVTMGRRALPAWCVFVLTYGVQSMPCRRC